MALSTKRSTPLAFYLFLSSVIISAHKMDDSFWKYQGASRLWGVHAVPFMFHLFWCLSSRRGRAESCLQQHKQPINAAERYWIKANNPTMIWQHPAIEIRHDYLGIFMPHHRCPQNRISTTKRAFYLSCKLGLLIGVKGICYGCLWQVWVWFYITNIKQRAVSHSFYLPLIIIVHTRVSYRCLLHP